MAKSDNRFSFTVKALNAVTCPPSGKPDRSGRVYVYDADEPGLAFRVTETGARSFYVCGNVNGAFKRVALADVVEVDGNAILEARKQARVKMAAMREGVDPIAEKKERVAEAAKIVPTVGILWDLYEAEKLPDLKAGTAKEYKRLYDAHVAGWKNRPIADITSEDCEILKTRVGKDSGKYAANRALAVVSAMFTSMGHRFGLPKKWTPTAGVEKFPEQQRDRVLSPEELAKLIGAIQAEENETIRDYFFMLLYTGARRSNVARMTWQNVSEQRQTWTIPGEKMKNGSPLVVTLVPQALAILERRHKSNPTDSPYVFPGRGVTKAEVEAARQLRDAGRSSYQVAKELGISQTTACRLMSPDYKPTPPAPFDGVSKAWKRIRTAAGISERTTPHDLRRTYVTNLLESGAALMHVAAAVGHRSTETTQKHYSVARQGLVADAVRAGVASMLGAAAKVTAAEKKKKKAG